MEIKQCLNGLMVYQPAFNEDVCAAKAQSSLKDSSKAAQYRLKTRSDLCLKIFFQVWRHL